MNKALHVFVYLFLIGVGAALWYEYQLNDKRSELRDRNKLLEDYLIRIASKVEDGSDYAPQALPAEYEIKIDTDDPFDPGLRPDVGEPTLADILGKVTGYNATYEVVEHTHLKWGTPEREALRDAFIIDATTGKPKVEGANLKTDDSVAQKKLEELVERMDAQNKQFEKTRAVFPTLRAELARVTELYNGVTPHLRAYIYTNETQVVEIGKLKEEKAGLEADKVKLQNDIKDQRQTIESLKGDLDQAQEETANVRDELEKEVKMVEALKKQVQTLLQERNTATTPGQKTELGQAISSLPFGDKGEIIRADNDFMYAIVRFDETAMQELKGKDLSQPLPMLELAVKRKGFNGPAGELVGRIRLRQEVIGKPLVMCDILSNWSQDPLQPGDIVFAVRE